MTDTDGMSTPPLLCRLGLHRWVISEDYTHRLAGLRNVEVCARCHDTRVDWTSGPDLDEHGNPIPRPSS